MRECKNRPIPTVNYLQNHYLISGLEYRVNIQNFLIKFDIDQLCVLPNVNYLCYFHFSIEKIRI